MQRENSDSNDRLVRRPDNHLERSGVSSESIRNHNEHTTAIWDEAKFKKIDDFDNSCN